MPVFLLSDEDTYFPAVEFSEYDRPLCVGGDLSIERLFAAYRMGIFPWYNADEPVMWWFTFPRMVLFLQDLVVSKSMRILLKNKAFRVTFDQDFVRVMRACRHVKRPDQDGSWINDDLEKSYAAWHEMGYVHSVEVWNHTGDLVGGLYGVSLGKVFYGESMFSNVPNASKYGFITLVSSLAQAGFQLVDCQQETPHLASLGAKPIPGKDFSRLLQNYAQTEDLVGNWGELLPIWRHSV
jgi:leucyl/phenylalanyl-tRNA---protein transferase